ncbi:MAG: septum formation initiator family protein [Spirochaetia bacterium]|jgi:cell division protein FtsB|nr:septum formation initiator family protein [Spirochaetales bacterium]
MRVPRIVVYVALSFVVTSLLFFFLGSGGLLDYDNLLAYRASLQENIADLEGTNDDLLKEVQALGSDPERLTLQARELGYFREGEKVVRIEGYRPGKSYYTVGKILWRKPKQPRMGWPFKALGLGLPILLSFVSFSVRRRKNREAGNR